MDECPVPGWQILAAGLIHSPAGDVEARAGDVILFRGKDLVVVRPQPKEPAPKPEKTSLIRFAL